MGKWWSFRFEGEMLCTYLPNNDVIFFLRFFGFRVSNEENDPLYNHFVIHQAFSQENNYVF